MHWINKFGQKSLYTSPLLRWRRREERDILFQSLKQLQKLKINQLEDDCINSILYSNHSNLSFVQENLYTVRVFDQSMSNTRWEEKDFYDAATAIEIISKNYDNKILYSYLKHKLNGILDAKLRTICPKKHISFTCFENFHEKISYAILKSNLSAKDVFPIYGKSLFYDSAYDAYYKLFTTFSEETVTLTASTADLLLK